VEKFFVNAFVEVNFVVYVTWVALTEVELSAADPPLTALAAVSVNGIETAVGSDVVETLRLLLPAVELLATPLIVTSIGSPAAALKPVVIVTMVPPADTVAVKHPCD
jgi:hypothetical protein